MLKVPYILNYPFLLCSSAMVFAVRCANWPICSIISCTFFWYMLKYLHAWYVWFKQNTPLFCNDTYIIIGYYFKHVITILWIIIMLIFFFNRLLMVHTSFVNCPSVFEEPILVLLCWFYGKILKIIIFLCDCVFSQQIFYFAV